MNTTYYDTDARRSNRSEVFCKKGVLKNFAKLTGEHLSVSLFVNKVAGWRPATLLKRDCNRCFAENFANNSFYKTPSGASVPAIKVTLEPYVRRNT